MRRKHGDCDPLRQFRRDWGEGGFVLKFVSEMGARERERLSLEEGERVLRRLPRSLLYRLNDEERRDLARAFGRPLLRLAAERREAEKKLPGRRPRASPI